MPTTDDEKAAPLLQRFDTFIRWLETSVEITPELKNHTKIDKALQLVALFNGAHGTKQARIAGNSGTGAYSIVVSGQYHDLDQDHGDVLYYSGSRSHDNEDPERPGESSRATLALKASWHSGRLVRVLRASGGMSRWVSFIIPIAYHVSIIS